MHRQRCLIALLAGLLALSSLPALANDPPRDYAALIDSVTLEAHVRTLAVEIGARPAGSETEARAADTIAALFAAWGYAVERQDVLFGTGDHAAHSQNVIATKVATATKPATMPGDQTRVIVIGAHMDSVTDGTGADDNASGVAAILAAAEALANLDTQHDIVFVAFGAEENGLNGSRAFVDALDPAALASIMVMFNVDTIGAGDFAYVYAGAISGKTLTLGPTWARDLALSVAAELGHDLRTSPPQSWDGFTGPWSDHYPFAEQHIPIAYLERWNWDAGDDPSWGVETASMGDIMHTARDQIDAVDPALIEPIAETLAATVARLATGEAHP